MFISNNNGKSNGNSPWNLTRASIDALVKAIEAGGDQIFSSYLRTMARFHNYSARNAILIAAQRPNATHLEGVRSWNELGRFVRPGEKGIYIFAPTVGATSRRNDSAPDAGVKKTGKGKKAAEPVAQPVSPEPQLLGFRGVYVFDIEQTGGEEVPHTLRHLDIGKATETLIQFAQSQSLTVEQVPWIAPHKATSYRGTIRILPGLEPAEEFPALLREVAGQMLFLAQRRTSVTRALHLQETKAAAFMVAEALQLECKAEFSDCQLYYGDAGMLAESLQVVHRAAAAILRAISPETGEFIQIAQEVN